MKFIFIALHLSTLICAGEILLARPHYPTKEGHVAYLQSMLSAGDELRSVDYVETEEIKVVILQTKLGELWIDQQETSDAHKEIRDALSVTNFRFFTDDDSHSSQFERIKVNQDNCLQAKSYSKKNVSNSKGVTTIEGREIWFGFALAIFKIPQQVKSIRIQAKYNNRPELDWVKNIFTGNVNFSVVPQFSKIGQFSAFCNIYLGGCELIGEFETREFKFALFYDKVKARLAACRLPNSSTSFNGLLALNILPKNRNAVTLDFEMAPKQQAITVNFANFDGSLPQVRSLIIGQWIDVALPPGSEIQAFDRAKGTIISTLNVK